MTLTPEQIELRRTGITSTDVAAICGLNPYKSAMEVYLDKVGRPLEREDTEAMYWGRALEHAIADRYAFDNRVTVICNAETLRHPKVEWALATPDAFVGEHEYGLELKTTASAKQVERWGSGGDAVPEEYLVQCHWCMFVCGLTRWDMAVLLATYHGFEYREYTLARDAGLEARLVQLADKFWTDTQNGIEPKPDGSESAKRALLALHAKPEPQLTLATSDDEDLLTDLLMAENEFKKAERERELARQKLMARIGDTEGIESPTQGKVYWKADRRGRRIFRPLLKGMD